MARLIAALSVVSLFGCPLPLVQNDAGQEVDAGLTTDAGSADAGSLDAGRLDDLSTMLEPLRAQGSLPGLAAAVIRGDELIALGAAGVRKQGTSTRVTLEDSWHLGSDTKAMTATLLGLVVDRGALHFGDTVPTVFPGETIDPSWQNVTLEQLLQHRGGAPANIPMAIWSQMWTDGAQPAALMTAVRALIAQPVAQAPGTYAYANAGYMIVGAALERSSGQGWETLIRTQLFEPLGMSSCGFGAAGTASLVDQPWGHTSAAVPVAPGPMADNPRSLGPAGTVHCSLRDWGKFASLHLAGERGENRLVTSATIKRLHVPPGGANYAAGWIVVSRPWAGGTALNHAGSNTLNYAVVWLAPSKNLAFLVATNIATPGTPVAVDNVFGPLIQQYAP